MSVVFVNKESHVDVFPIITALIDDVSANLEITDPTSLLYQ